MPNGPWTAYSGGFQNGMTLAITPKNVVLRDNSLKPLLQCINYVILKIFKIETFWSTLMAKFMLLGFIGMCSINFMQKKFFLGIMHFDWHKIHGMHQCPNQYNHIHGSFLTFLFTVSPKCCWFKVVFYWYLKIYLPVWGR